jgi:hypothetical protein
LEVHLQITIEPELVMDRQGGPRRPGAYFVKNAGPVLTQIDCDRLPLYLPGECPTCGGGIKPARQPRFIANLGVLTDGVHEPCAHGEKRAQCPLCWPTQAPALLCWLPARTYTPELWLMEVKRIGSVSWTMAVLPNAYRAGRTWVLIASKTPEPHIFAYFLGGTAETVLWKSQINERIAYRAAQRGVKMYYVEEDDPDYAPFLEARQGRPKGVGYALPVTH